jgi:hypothetical protein
MREFILDFGPDMFIGLVAVVGGLLIPIIAITGAWIYKHRRLSIEAALKQQMIERGMSADEIKAVLEASIPDRSHRRCARASAVQESSRRR